MRTTLLVGALSLSTACADLLGPSSTSTVYALQSLDDQALPALIGEAGPFSASYVDADSLVLLANGTARWIRHARLELDAGGPILNRLEETVAVLRRGSAFTFESPRPCLMLPTCSDPFVVGPARLPNEFTVVGEDGARRYVRVTSAP